MSPTSHPFDTRYLKKRSYQMLRKMHGLENGDSFTRIVGKKIGIESAVVLCITDLNACFQVVLAQVTDKYAGSPTKKFLNHLNRFSKTVRLASNGSRPIKKGKLAKLLSSHTTAFNRMLERRISLQMEAEQRQQFLNALRAAVAIWGERFI